MNNKRFFSLKVLARETSPLKLKNAHQKVMSNEINGKIFELIKNYITIITVMLSK